MRVLITGVGDAFTCRHFGSSALIEAPGGYVLLDCPDLVHRAVGEAAAAAGWPVAAADAGDVILTHLHGDHANGLESLGFLRRQMRGDDPALPRPRLHTIAAVAERVWERLAPAMDGPFAGHDASTLEDYFDLRILRLCDGAAGPAEAGGEVAGLRVRCRLTLHPIPTIGLLLSDGRATLGWSGDTAFDPEHLEWLGAADLIVHETSPGSVHTPIESLNALPREIRAKMRLIHLPDDFDPSTTGIPPLREGEVLEVPYPR